MIWKLEIVALQITMFYVLEVYSDPQYFRVLSQVISDKRSLLLSRSSYFGSGVVSGHFVKENTASWEDMKHSIVGR